MQSASTPDLRLLCPPTSGRGKHMLMVSPSSSSSSSPPRRAAAAAAAGEKTPALVAPFDSADAVVAEEQARRRRHDGWRWWWCRPSWAVGEARAGNAIGLRSAAYATDDDDGSLGLPAVLSSASSFTLSARKDPSTKRSTTAGGSDIVKPRIKSSTTVVVHSTPPNKTAPPTGDTVGEEASRADADDDAGNRAVEATGYRMSLPLEVLYWILVILSLGSLLLMRLWFRTQVSKARARRVSVEKADFFVIKLDDGKEVIEKKRTQRIRLEDLRLGVGVADVSNIAAWTRVAPPTDSTLLGVAGSDEASTEIGNGGTTACRCEDEMIDSDGGRFLAGGGGAAAAVAADGGKAWAEVICFTFQYQKYIYAGSEHGFLRVESQLTQGTHFSDLWVNHGKGVCRSEVIESRRRLFGLCEVNIPLKSSWHLFVSECFHPFYVFQICSLILWFSDNYYYYASAVLLLSSASLVTSIRETLRNNKNLHEMAQFSCPIRVLRAPSICFASNRFDFLASAGVENHLKVIDSKELVVGDIFCLERETRLPCDSLLLIGNALVDESMMTGESKPVHKSAIPHQGHDEIFNIAKHSRSVLFEGSSVCAAGNRGGPAFCVVLRVGFATTQGQMLKALVYPGSNATGMNFERETWKFVALLGSMSCITFVWTLYQGIINGLRPLLIVKRSFDTVTIAVPPALPIIVSVGVICAQESLKKLNGTTCLMPSRINVAGRVNVMVFDKTGTLTEDDEDLLAVVPALQSGDTEPATDSPKYTDPAETHASLSLLPPAALAMKKNVDPTYLLRAESSWQLQERFPRGMPLPRRCLSAPKEISETSQQDRTKLLRTARLVMHGWPPDPSVVAANPEPAGPLSQAPLGSGVVLRTSDRVPGRDGRGERILDAAHFGSATNCAATLSDELAGSLATCHSLSIVSDQLIGDPLEFQMFTFTDWRLHPPVCTASASPDGIKNPDVKSDCDEDSGNDSSTKASSSTKSTATCDDATLETSSDVASGNPPRLDWRRYLSVSRPMRAPQPSYAPPGPPDIEVANGDPGVALQRQLEGPALVILRVFEFDSELQCMTVIVQETDSGRLWVISKGSPERMRRLCLASSCPRNWNEVLAKHCEKGLRILTIARKPLIVPPGHDHSATALEKYISSIKRGTVECDLKCLGLLLFTNLLRPDSAPTIASLQKAGCCVYMATGDGQATSAAVGYQAGVLHPATTEIVQGTLSACGRRVSWELRPFNAGGAGEEEEEDGRQTPKNKSKDPPKTPIRSDSLLQLIEGKCLSKLGFIITGEAFRHLVYGSEHHAAAGNAAEVATPRGGGPRIASSPKGSGGSSGGTDVAEQFQVQAFTKTQPRKGIGRWCCGHGRATTAGEWDDPRRNLVAYGLDATSEAPGRGKRNKRKPVMPCCRAWGGSCHTFQTAEFVLRYFHIFCRMKPADKSLLVRKLQQLTNRPTVGMCGDGANDCAALKAADVGISLSSMEASVAAPFNSARVKSIAVVLGVLREGRGALTNSIQNFQFVALYALIQLCTVTLLSQFGDSLSDSQFLYMDLVVVLPLTYFMSWSRSSSSLKRVLPPESLLAWSIVVSLIGQTIIQVAFEIFCLHFLLPIAGSYFYRPFEPDTSDETVVIGFENTVAFLVSNIQTVVVAIVLAFGTRPWKAVSRNLKFLLVSATFAILGFALLLNEAPYMLWLRHLLTLVSLPLSFRTLLLFAVACNALLSLALEHCVVRGAVRRREISQDRQRLNRESLRNADVDERILPRRETKEQDVSILVSSHLTTHPAYAFLPPFNSPT